MMITTLLEELLVSSNLPEKHAKRPVDENECVELTDAQKQELDRRIQSAQQNPQVGRTWEEIKSEFLNSK